MSAAKAAISIKTRHEVEDHESTLQCLDTEVKDEPFPYPTWIVELKGILPICFILIAIILGILKGLETGIEVGFETGANLALKLYRDVKKECSKKEYRKAKK